MEPAFTEQCSRHRGPSFGATIEELAAHWVDDWNREKPSRLYELTYGRLQKSTRRRVRTSFVSGAIFVQVSAMAFLPSGWKLIGPVIFLVLWFCASPGMEKDRPWFERDTEWIVAKPYLAWFFWILPVVVLLLTLIAQDLEQAVQSLLFALGLVIMLRTTLRPVWGYGRQVRRPQLLFALWSWRVTCLIATTALSWFVLFVLQQAPRHAEPSQSVALMATLVIPGLIACGGAVRRQRRYLALRAQAADTMLVSYGQEAWHMEAALRSADRVLQSGCDTASSFFGSKLVPYRERLALLVLGGGPDLLPDEDQDPVVRAVLAGAATVPRGEAIALIRDYWTRLRWDIDGKIDVAAG